MISLRWRNMSVLTEGSAVLHDVRLTITHSSLAYIGLLDGGNLGQVVDCYRDTVE